MTAATSSATRSHLKGLDHETHADRRNEKSHEEGQEDGHNATRSGSTVSGTSERPRADRMKRIT